MDLVDSSHEARFAGSEITQDEVQNIRNIMNTYLEMYGYEVHPFKIGWYNEIVSRQFHLPYPPDTLAFVILSIPDMFEKAFVPFIRKKSYVSGVRDPIDECVSYYLGKTLQLFPDHCVDIIHDYDMHPNRKPKILVQTAGHLSGAVYFYQESYFREVEKKSRKMYGVCIHPLYGGWFALRGVLVFRTALAPDLQQEGPVDVLQDEGKCKELLDLFNFHWKNDEFRDIIPVKKKYSSLQRTYFQTPPCERIELLEYIRESL